MCDHYDNYFKEEDKPMAKDAKPTQWYKVKEAFVPAVKKLAGHKLTGDQIKFPQYSYLHRDLCALNLLEVFCEEIPKEVDPWIEPGVKTGSWGPNHSPNGSVKATLLIKMQSWADYHNKLDGFVVDWGNTNEFNYGISIQNYDFGVTKSGFTNLFLFQITVSSKERANEMLKYFHKDIQSLIDKCLI